MELPKHLPIAYQGSKKRQADEIASYLIAEGGKRGKYVEICGGSGAVSYALVKQGVPAKHITYVEIGSWAAFWRSVANGSFSMPTFAWLVRRAQKLKQPALRYLAANDPGILEPEIFLLLQAAVARGVPVSWNGSAWLGIGGFRAPCTGSPNTIPGADTLAQAVEKIACAMKGLRVVRTDARTFKAPTGSIVYADPPYPGTAKYVTGVITPKEIVRCAAGNPVAISLHTKLSRDAIQLKSVAPAGTQRVREEWLSWFNRGARHAG